MSSFTEALIIKRVITSEGAIKADEQWEVHTAFCYYIGDIDSSDFVRVPAGTRTDLASIPVVRRMFRGDQAAVLHDYLYRHGRYHTKPAYLPVRITRAKADLIFYEAMLVLGVSRMKAWFFYRSVRAFGGKAWRQSKKRRG